MTVVIGTGNATKLLASIRLQIDAGRIDTWEYDAQGCFTSRSKKWHNKATLRPSIPATGHLKFDLIVAPPEETTPELIGAYEGRFIEMLLTHLHDQIAWASAIP